MDGLIRSLAAPVCIFLASLCPKSAVAQDFMQAIGHPTFSSSEPVELGSVDVANGNLHLEIMLGSYPQRGGRTLTYKLVYDSRIWNHPTNVSWSPNTWANPMGGWRFVSSADSGGPVGFSTWSTQCGSGGAGGSYNFYWTAPDGTIRYFPNVTTSSASSGCGTTSSSSTGYANDSSGYYMSITNYSNIAAVIAPDGTQIYPSYKDPNGNFYQKDSNGNITADTLGRQPVIITTSCGSANKTCYDFLNSQGTSRSRVTLTTTSIPVHTNFGQQYLTEFSGTLPTVLQSITLPDMSTYQFAYDSGSTAGHYGEITGITLPTGGTVSYGYTVYQDEMNNKHHWVSQRTSGGHTWTYNLNNVVVWTSHKVTVTEPSGDSKTYSFFVNNGAWRNSLAYSSGTTITDSWNTSHTCQSPCTGGAVNIQKTAETITPAGSIVSQQRQFTYNTQYVPFPSIVKEWNYGLPVTGTPSRITNIAYLSDGNSAYLNANILGHPTSIVVTDGNGTKFKETDYSYDTTSLTSKTSFPQHDDTNFGTGNTVRGNRTSISQWVSGTTSITTATVYYDTTGQMVQGKDANNNSTTFDYTDCFLTGNPPGTYSPTPTNAHLTKTTLPNGNTVTACYYYNTGKTAWTKDQNANQMWHYFALSGGSNDPFDREMEETFPGGGWVLNNYTSSTQLDTYLGIQDATASTSCSSCRHDRTVRDTLGRAKDQYLVNDPDGQVLVHTDFDVNGRVLDTTHPYRTTGDSTYGLETVSYDGQNRPIQVTHQDSTKAKTYYGNSVTAAGGVGTQLCPTGTCAAGYPTVTMDEMGKIRQVWTDIFGKVVEVDEPAASASTGGSGTATGTVTITGGSDQSINHCPPNSCYEYDSGSFPVTVGGVTKSVQYGAGSFSDTLATALASAFNSDPASPVTASSSGALVTFSSKFNYAISVGTGGHNPDFASASFGATPSGASMTGGVIPQMSAPTVTYYLYDAVGNLTQVTTVGSQECSRTYQYDGLSRLTSSTEPEPGNGPCTGSGAHHTTTYSYTTSGAACSGDPSKVCSRTDGRGITTTYTYDSLNRPLGMTYSDGTTSAVTYSYDQTSYNGLTITNGKGQRTGMSDGSGATAWSYDANGNIVKERRTISGISKTITYSYNKDNSLNSLTYPSGRVVNFNINNAQRTTSAIDSDQTQYVIAPSSGAMYTPTGALASAVFGKGSVFTGLTEARTYNNRLQITGISASSSAGTALNLAYSYTGTNHSINNGEIVSIVNNADSGRTENLTYDDLGRVSTASSQATTGPNCWGQNFTFDIVANLTGITPSNCSSTSLSASVNQNNQLTTNYTYDAAGNMINEGSSAYAYNAENEITSAGGVTYQYDGNRMRVQKSSGTLYWRDISGNTIAETNLSGSTTNEYVFFEGRRAVQRNSSGNIYYYQSDQVGTTRSITKVTTGGSASICYDAEFTPYGSEMAHTSTCAPNYKFTGYERDAETGLDYAFNRHYNPRLGRFMSSDPLGPASANYSNPQSMNRYAYALNNPMSFNDPRGLDCVYLNSTGTYYESIDANSDAGECQEHGGYWFQGTVDPGNLDYDPDSNWLGLTDSNGNPLQAACAGSSSACAGKQLADMGADYASLLANNGLYAGDLGQQMFAYVGAGLKDFGKSLCAHLWTWAKQDIVVSATDRAAASALGRVALHTGNPLAAGGAEVMLDTSAVYFLSAAFEAGTATLAGCHP